MSQAEPIPRVCGIAREGAEIAAVQRLLYRTFVEEIPHHPANPAQTYVDRFHCENTYFICRRGTAILGTIAYRARRPFSLDQKLGNVENYLPPDPERKLCEIRLLAVEPSERYSRVAWELIQVLAEHAIGEGCNCALISGTIRQLKFYHHLGFADFGPLVGKPGAEFQPMQLSLAQFRSTTAKWRTWETGSSHSPSRRPEP